MINLLMDRFPTFFELRFPFAIFTYLAISFFSCKINISIKYINSKHQISVNSGQ